METNHLTNFGIHLLAGTGHPDFGFEQRRGNVIIRQEAETSE